MVVVERPPAGAPATPEQVRVVTPTPPQGEIIDFPVESFPLIEKPPFVTVDEVRSLPNLCPKFSQASWYMAKDGTLERLCIALIRSRKVEGRTEEEAKRNALV